MRLCRKIAAITLVAIAPLPFGYVHADDAAQCNRQLPAARIPGCTRLIENPRLDAAARARAFANRGRAYLRMRGAERLAEADFTNAARLMPKHSIDAEVYQGYVRLARRQFESAIKYFTRALVRQPRHVLARIGRGGVYRVTGDLERSLVDTATAARIEPGNVAALAAIGLVYRAKRDHERAITYFDSAIKLEPSYANALRWRAHAKLSLGRTDEAISDFDAAIANDPEVADAYNGRGYARMKKGERLRALSDFDAAIRLAPSLIPPYLNRAKLLADQGATAKAMKDYEYVLTLPATRTSDRGRHQLARERLASLRKITAASRSTSPRLGGHRRVALVIGNSRYRSAGRLPNPANDAKAMAVSLRRLGFTKIIERIDVTRDRMISALKELGDLSQGAEWSLVFFAGHGMEIKGTNYLIPVDAVLKRDTHAEDEAISLDRVMAKVDAASRMGLVILDACRNNPFSARMLRSGGATRAIGRGLAPVEPEGNVLVAYAARHGTVAEDGSGSNSPFTAALLSYIEEPGLEVNFLFRKVRDAVLQKTGRRQMPFIYGSLGSEPVYFRSASLR